MLVAVDVETFYGDGYTLRTMTVPEYVMDPRFEAIMWGVQQEDWPEARWYTPEDFTAYLHNLKADGEPITMVSHNALFDMFVLRHRFGYTPEVMLDTLGMSRAILGPKLKSHSLAAVAEHLGFPAKGSTVHKLRNMTRHMIEQDPDLHHEAAEYCKHDTWLCLQIHNHLMQFFPPSEIKVMDAVLRCAVVPRFKLNTGILTAHLHMTQIAKQALLDQCGLTSRETLMSNDKFATALTNLGVTPPRKTSPVTGKVTYAFAKSDAEFLELQDHDDPAVQALVAARLGVKSTLEETRTERMIKIGSCWPDGAGWMPMPLKYSGAHTHRLSGDWKINVQNFGRGSPIRAALEVPEGMRVVAADASQIEARILATLAEQDDLVDDFAAGVDIYSKFAETIYNYEVSKKTHPVERFVGKTSILGLGYGLGDGKFCDTIKVQSRNQLNQVLDMPATQAQFIVQTYRRRFRKIVQLWYDMNDLIGTMTNRDAMHLFRGLIVGHEKIILPNGMMLQYPELTNQGGEWLYRSGKEVKRLYGGKLTENVVQALARIATMEAAMRLDVRIDANWPAIVKWYPDRDQFRLALQVHDELVYVVPEPIADTILKMLIQEMSRAPSWMPKAPLTAEGGVGVSYGEVK